MAARESNQAAFDPEKVDRAINAFANLELTQIEALLVSGRLAIENLRAFRARIQDLRREMGDRVSAEFARNELNDLICDLQDAIAPTIRAYNALLRDPEEKGTIEP